MLALRFSILQRALLLFLPLVVIVHQVPGRRMLLTQLWFSNQHDVGAQHGLNDCGSNPPKYRRCQPGVLREHLSFELPRHVFLLIAVALVVPPIIHYSRVAEPVILPPLAFTPALSFGRSPPFLH